MALVPRCFGYRRTCKVSCRVTAKISSNRVSGSWCKARTGGRETPPQFSYEEVIIVLFFFVGVGYLLRQSMKIEREASAIMSLANATFALELALLKVQSSDVIIPNCKILV